MNKYKRLLNNSIIFSIGNFGSKLILFLMVPVYTKFLSESDYGLTDIVLVTVNLLVPVLTLSIGQAVLRFLMDKSQAIKKKDIYTLTVIFLSVLTFFIGIVIYYSYVNNNIILVYILIILILNIFNDFQSQFTRGLNLIKQYAFNGILSALSISISGIFFLAILDWNLQGYFISSILTLLLSNIYLLLVTRGWRYISFKHIQFTQYKILFSYSIPLIPNSIMWWLINDATRYFILYFIGLDGNGLFAVATKLPSIISMVISIFMQAWQISAFEEYSKEKNELFYSKVFVVFYMFIFIIASLIVLMCRFIFNQFIPNQFYYAYKLVPVLIFASIYQGFSGFFGTVYTASMKTKGIFISSIIGAVVSLIINSVMIPIFGLSGAGIGIFSAFFCTWIIRMNDTLKIMKLNIDIKLFFKFNIIFIMQLVLISVGNDKINFLLEGICFLSLLGLLVNKIVKHPKK